MSEHRTTNVYLVAAGQYHDIDFARLELLKLLAEDDKIRVTVASDYSDVEGIQASDFLITYTCNLVPSEAEPAWWEPKGSIRIHASSEIPQRTSATSCEKFQKGQSQLVSLEVDWQLHGSPCRRALRCRP